MQRVGRIFRCIALSCLITFWASSNAAVTEPATVWSGDVDAPVPSTIAGGKVIHARALARLIKRKDVVVIDVSKEPRRPAELAPGAPWLPVPHRALPVARWIPGVGAGAISAQLEDQFRRQLSLALGEDVHRPLVFYCHARCWLSWNAAKRAIGYGYKRVFWFPDGIEGWTAAGRQTKVAAPQGPAAQETPPPSGETAAPPGAADGQRAEGGLPALVVLDLELTGDLGGPEFEAEHAERLRTMSARLRQDLDRTGLYRILDNSAAQGLIDTLKSRQAYLHDCNGCDLDVGRSLHADQVLVAWVDRVSGLILSLTYEVHDVQTGQITARKSFDFRGDNDNAWNHAIDYMARDLAKNKGS